MTIEFGEPFYPKIIKQCTNYGRFDTLPKEKERSTG